jgi:RNA polymerase sigma-70 factor (ECF subfamily)
MGDHDWLAERFELDRARLRAVAYRMLGSTHEADDAVQEAWLRLGRSGASGVENLTGWLTTVVARLCLDMLRARKAKREEPLDEVPTDALAAPEGDPERDALLGDSVGLALLVVLETLTPAERVSFVLHDLFAVPFEEIAPIVRRSPTAARKLASRARRRVRGAEATDEPDRARQRAIIEAFLAASRGGDLGALVALLDPQVVLSADDEAARMGGEAEVRGADAVAGTFVGRARVAQAALVDGVPGAVWLAGGRPRVVFRFTIDRDRIATIELLADPERIQGLDLLLLDVSAP